MPTERFVKHLKRKLNRRFFPFLSCSRLFFLLEFLCLGQVNNTSWPDGPTTLDALFRWPAYNCCCFLNDPEIGEDCANSAMELMQYDIYVNDAFSGTGSGSYTLHLQHAHLRSF